ncbi:MAG TPA: hypothetical protein PLR12_04960, partial [Clostridia bacterium]|nr:hypothetical protein [Clostridia bacterium]
DVLSIGDAVEVKVSEIDSQGRINLLRNDMEYKPRTFNRPGPGGEGGGRPPRRDGRPPRRDSN